METTTTDINVKNEGHTKREGHSIEVPVGACKIGKITLLDSPLDLPPNEAVPFARVDSLDRASGIA
jgi:hypothetical protein